MKRLLTGLAIGGAVIVGSLFIGEMVTEAGHHSVMKVAGELGSCKADPCTPNEEDAVYAILTDTFGYPPLLIDWCMGVDDVAGTRVYRGGLVKSVFVWVGNMPCSKITGDKPA